MTSGATAGAIAGAVAGAATGYVTVGSILRDEGRVEYPPIVERPATTTVVERGRKTDYEQRQYEDSVRQQQQQTIHQTAVAVAVQQQQSQHQILPQTTYENIGGTFVVPHISAEQQTSETNIHSNTSSHVEVHHHHHHTETHIHSSNSSFDDRSRSRSRNDERRSQLPQLQTSKGRVTSFTSSEELQREQAANVASELQQASQASQSSAYQSQDQAQAIQVSIISLHKKSLTKI